MFRAVCAHHQEVQIVLYSIWCHHAETSEWSNINKYNSINMSTDVKRLKNIAKILSRSSRYNIYAGQTDGVCQFKEGLSVSRYVCWFVFHFYGNKT